MFCFLIRIYANMRWCDSKPLQNARKMCCWSEQLKIHLKFNFIHIELILLYFVAVLLHILLKSFLGTWNKRMYVLYLYVQCRTSHQRLVKNIQATKISRVLQQQRTRNQRTPRSRWLPLSVRLRTSQNTSFVFFSLLDEFHRVRGIEGRGLPSPKHFRMFAYTLIRKQNIVSPWMTSQANSSHSSLFLGRGHGKDQFYAILKFIANYRNQLQR